ncbi:pVIII [Egyptian fruit bat adenovirus]|uniref:Pre-hexon-linking protein VIII n=1 Tax=Egyptian fruit bat adenovirus TaxID=2849732 RepID=A0A344X9V5_9ADEN|nr:pVIII [Rousettus aegyptiacus adenovirus]AXE75637.1 pVIII [Egyptian fruit bat adenovirus]
MGVAAGASQDYSTQMNWLSAGNRMISKVFAIRDKSNNILQNQAVITETPRVVQNPPIWQPQAIQRPMHYSTILKVPRNQALEKFMSNSGMQLAGGGLTGGSLQLAEVPPVGMPIRSDGVCQLAGGSADITPGHAYLLLQSSSTVPRAGGIGADQFVQEFVPSVYCNPFAGPPSSFPDQFIHNYDIVSDSVAEYS